MNDSPLRRCVEEVVATEVHACDAEKRLLSHDFDHIVVCISDRVCARMVYVQHMDLDDEDLAFIRRTSARMVEVRIRSPGTGLRFVMHDRVVCRLKGEREWAAGCVVKLDHDDGNDPTSEHQIPYLVKIDPPKGRVVCAPRDDNDVVRAEVCFSQDADGLSFALYCKPRNPTKTRRFGVGDRVACAIDDITGDDITWASGTVRDVNYDVGPDARKAFPSWDWPCADGVLPYRVLLDNDEHVLVHRDEHWLVRDLRLQPPGPRHASVVSKRKRNLTRFTRRRDDDVRLWTPQQTYFFPRQFRERALATLCAAYRLRTHPPPGGVACLGDLPSELLLGIIAASAGREQIDHTTRQIRVQSDFDSDCDE